MTRTMLRDAGVGHGPAHPPEEEQRRHGYHLLELLAFAIALVILVVVAVPYFSATATVHATIVQIVPQGTSADIVTVVLENGQHSAVTPTCEIDLSSAAGAYTGDDSFSPGGPIPAGFSASYDVLVPVTGGGAGHIVISASSVSCR